MCEYKVEICANSVASCIEAQKGGAYRVELCAGIPEGGTTPSYGEVMVAREQLDIKLNVIIRPRSGDFLYSDLEHQTMLKDIEMMKKIGVDGVVIGSLTPKGDVDMQRNRELIEAAEGLSVTFHRAFDMCRNPFDNLERIIDLGCDRLLTSGQMPKAYQGVDLIKKLVKQADDRIIIMAGSGVNKENIRQIAEKTGVKEFHFSARTPHESQMIFRNLNVSMGGKNINIDEYKREITSAKETKETLKALYKYH